MKTSHQIPTHYVKTALHTLLVYTILFFISCVHAKGGGGSAGGSSGGGSSGGSFSGGGTYIGSSSSSSDGNGSTSPLLWYICGPILGIIFILFLIYICKVTTPRPPLTCPTQRAQIQAFTQMNRPALLESYNNATGKEYDRGLKYEKKHPPTHDTLPSNEAIQYIQSHETLYNAFLFETVPETQSKINIESDWTLSFKTRKSDISILSKCPLWKNFTFNEKDISYFEVTVTSIEYQVSATTVVSIGLATKPYPWFRLIGWNRHSVGYHSDDGRIFYNNGFGGCPFQTPFTRGDTVGCGHDPDTGDVFFTLNGELLRSGNGQFIALTGIRKPFHAAVGADGPCELFINVGQEAFKFQPQKETIVDIPSTSQEHTLPAYDTVSMPEP